MAKQAEVYVGRYLADAQLVGGMFVLTIDGANLSERLFEKLIKDEPVIKLVGFRA